MHVLSVQVFLIVMRGATYFGLTISYLDALSSAPAAGVKVFEVIDTVPQIDSQSEDGKKLESVLGDIEFRDVSFNYASRPDVKVCRLATQ